MKIKGFERMGSEMPVLPEPFFSVEKKLRETCQRECSAVNTVDTISTIA